MRRGWTTIGLVIGLGCWPSIGAGKASLQGTVALFSGLSAGPSSGSANLGFQGDLRPGLQLFAGGQRTLSRLVATALLGLGAGGGGAMSAATGGSLCGTRVSCSVGGRIEYSLAAAPSPRTSLVLNLSTTLSHLAGINTLAASPDTTLGASTLSPLTAFQGGGGESFGWDVGPRFRVSQSASAGAFVPLTSTAVPKSFFLGGRLLLEYLFRLDSLGLDAGATYADFLGIPAVGKTAALPRRQALDVSALARWRRDWNPFWSTQVGLGALGVAGLGKLLGNHLWEPAGTASVRYGPEIGELELAYAHAALPSIFIGQSFLVDQVTLRGGTSFRRQRISLGVGGGYQYARQVTGGRLGGAAHVGLVDGTAGWSPRDEIALALRYQLFLQQPIDAGSSIPGGQRHLLLFTVEAIFPHERLATFRARAPRRVDGGDAVLFGP